MHELTPPLLVYDRIGANIRRSRLLLVAFALSLLPVLVVLLPYLAELFLMMTGIFAASVLGQLDAPTSEIGEEDLFLLFGVSMAAAVVALVGIAYLHLRLASALVLRISGARPLRPGEEVRLSRTVENLCIGAGLPVPKMHIVESSAPNLFSTGLDPERASLVLTRGLLELLEPQELEGVVAHELVQIGNRDTRLGTVLAAGVALLRLPSTIAIGFFRLLFRLHPIVGWGAILYLGVPMVVSVPASVAVAKTLHDEGETLQAYIVLALMLLYLYVFFLAPVLGQVLLRAVSRERIRLSDADALLLTRSPAAYARALSKIDEAGQQDMTVNPAVAHLYFVDPRPNAPWWDRLLATHPPPGERLDAITRMASFPPSELQEAREAGRRFSQERSAVTPPVAASSSAGEHRSNEPAGSRRYAGAFRIGGEGTVIYSEPRVTATPVAQLRRGDLIVVQAEEGEFLLVLTSNDKSGFILRSAAGEPVEIQRPPPS